jgi:hypothetical protein
MRFIDLLLRLFALRDTLPSDPFPAEPPMPWRG